MEREHQKLIEDIEKDPYRAIRPREKKFQSLIPMETWKIHIQQVLCDRETRPSPRRTQIANTVIPFTTREIKDIIRGGRNNRTPGVDGIRNEHLKQSPSIPGNLDGPYQQMLRNR